MTVNEKNRITEDHPGFFLKIRTIANIGKDPGIFSTCLKDHEFVIRSRNDAILILKAIALYTLEDLDSVEITEFSTHDEYGELVRKYNFDMSFEEKYFGINTDEKEK